MEYKGVGRGTGSKELKMSEKTGFYVVNSSKKPNKFSYFQKTFKTWCKPDSDIPNDIINQF